MRYPSLRQSRAPPAWAPRARLPRLRARSSAPSGRLPRLQARSSVPDGRLPHLPARSSIAQARRRRRSDPPGQLRPPQHLPKPRPLDRLRRRLPPPSGHTGPRRPRTPRPARPRRRGSRRTTPLRHRYPPRPLSAPPGAPQGNHWQGRLPSRQGRPRPFVRAEPHPCSLGGDSLHRRLNPVRRRNLR
jgi:hypothetical protein